MRRAWLFLYAALAFAPRTAWPQGTPLGPEFRVNTYTTGAQSYASVASDPSGNFIVVWGSQDGSLVGVFGQHYFASGVPLGPEFLVNTYTTGFQGLPSVAADPLANFVVVWTSNPQDGSSYGVFGQRYNASGNPLGPEFRVNTYTTNPQTLPSVAADSSGNFVVVWSSVGQDGVGYESVFGQRYAASGSPLGPEFPVNTYTTGTQSRSSVATDSSGGFVVVWESNGQDGSSFGIFGQRYAGSGTPLGSEFRVNTFTTGPQRLPSVATDFPGGFVVVWGSDGQDGSGYGIFAQRYASSGTPLGTEFRVNTFTTNYQSDPSVASDAAGNFVVVWRSDGQDGSGRGVFGQRYAGSGTPLGPEFHVNTFTTSDQLFPSVAADASGNFVVAWQSYGQDGSGDGVFGQRYGEVIPVELMGLTVE